MRFGIAYASHPRVVESAVEADRLGYDSVHLYDTPLVFSDVFVVAGAVAERVKRVAIGISVAVPFLRLPHVLAVAAGTLNQMAPGRVRLGLGTGYTAALTTGSPPDSWSTVEEYVRICRRILSGQEVEADVKGRRVRIAHLHSELGYINAHDYVPIYISAAGPKGRSVTARIADGFCAMSAGQRPDPLELRVFIDEMQEDASAQGRRRLDVVLFTTMAVKEPGEPSDSPRLLGAVGPSVSQHFHGDLGFGPEDPRTPALLREAAQRYHREIGRERRSDAPWLENHRGHAIFVRPEEAHLLSAKLIDAVAQVGTPEELVAEIRALEAAGVDEVVWQVSPGYESEVERFAREVMVPYRQAAAGGEAA